MLVTKDFTLGYTVTEFDGFPELMELCVDSCLKAKESGHYVGVRPQREEDFTGQRFESWEALRVAAQTRWERGLKEVDNMRQEIESTIPAPVSRKRRRRLSEDQGEVDVDRVMAGDTYCYNEVRREESLGSNVITVVTNFGGHCGRSVEELFWRTAAVVVVVEKLEEAGYQCEVVGWARSEQVHPYATPKNTFDVLRLKEAGTPLDVNYMVNGLSPWAYRLGIFGTWHSENREVHSYYGQPKHDLPSGLLKYLRLDESTRAVWMPGVFSQREAIREANRIIEEVQQHSN
jgi:hypothetical protein